MGCIYNIPDRVDRRVVIDKVRVLLQLPPSEIGAAVDKVKIWRHNLRYEKGMYPYVNGNRLSNSGCQGVTRSGAACGDYVLVFIRMPKKLTPRLRCVYRVDRVLSMGAYAEPMAGVAAPPPS
jgi:hypothetical protein